MSRSLSSRCLSDDVLLRVASELGTPAQHSHLTSCASCAMRYRRWSGELGMIRQVLVTTEEPRRPTARSRLRTVAGVAALSAAAVAALLWIEVTAWKAFQSEPDVASAEQIETTLADVTAALFSVEGEPARVVSDTQIEAVLTRDSDASPECDGQPWLGAPPCPGGPFDLEESQDASEMQSVDANEMEAMDHTTSDADRADLGG
jgi:hypothetical protein